MGKRTNQAATKSTAKKAKTDPVLASIADVIMEAEELPSRCRNMLVDILPFSVSVQPDERHVIQVAAADMVEQTLNGKKSAMESVVSNEEGKLAELKSSQTGLTTALTEAEAALTTHKEVLHTMKCALAEAATAANSSRTILTDLTREQKEADTKLQSAREEKGSLESAFENHFKPMKDDAAGPHFKELEPFLKKIQMEESLLIALPSTCA
jgi:chromosome segregation ATPase